MAQWTVAALLIVAVGAVFAIPVCVIDRAKARQEADVKAAGDKNCREATWALVSPSGVTEDVPMRYVQAAVTTRDYHFPPEADIVLIGEASDGPCQNSGGFWVSGAVDALRRTDRYSFRGYRKATDEERAGRALETKYGRPQ